MVAHIVGSNLGEEIDVVVRMELCHFPSYGRVRTVTIHLLIESIGQDQMVGQLEAVRFHRVGGSIVEEGLNGTEEGEEIHIVGESKLLLTQDGW